MRVDQKLNFGTIAIKDNSQIWSLRLLSNGTISADNSIIILENGHIGQYFFYNLPPSSQISISILSGTGDTSFSGSSTQAQFTIEPYLDFPTYYTNAFGELNLVIPAVLKTSGDGKTYSDGIYYRFFQLNINF